MIASNAGQYFGQAALVAALLTASITVKSETMPVTVNPLTFDTEGEHYQYRMHMSIQGQDVFWDLTQGPEVTLIVPDEEHLSRVSGFDPLYTGKALDDRPHQVESRFDALASMMPVVSSQPPLEYEDVFDNRQRVDSVRVAVEPTGETRQLAGREANAYTLAVVSDKSRWDNGDWRPYHLMNIGTIWVYDDLAFSPAPLQLSRHVFNLVFAPHSVGDMEDYSHDLLISALSPLGLLAGARMQEVEIPAEDLAELEAGGWLFDGDEPPGRSLGIRFELLTTEIDTDAAPLDYSALETMSRMDAASLDYLETPLMMANFLDLCPAFPEDIDTASLQAMLADNASFEGTIQGSINDETLGLANFGSQDDSFGRGFLLTLEAYDSELQQAACLTLLRVDAGMPDDSQTLAVAAGSDQSEPGDIVAYLTIVDMTEPGRSQIVASGLGSAGELTLEHVDEEIVEGYVRVDGQVTPLDQLTDSQPFFIEGEFSAMQAWDRVPVAR